MRGTIFLLIVVSLAMFWEIGCKSPQSSNTTLATQNDSLGEKVKDTVNQKLDQDSLELVNIYSSYIQQYKDTISIDTSFVSEKGRLRILLHHYCLQDSTIVLPDKYTEMYGIRKFVTHNFVSSLKIIMNDSCVVDSIVQKKIFEDQISSELNKYGVLRSPVLRFQNNNQVNIDYSLSIPLTDVGELVTFVIFTDRYKKE